MQRLVFTIVTGFFGGSGSGDDVAPLQREDAEHARLGRPLGELPHRPARPRDDAGQSGAGESGAAGESKGFA
jgi:hypothetical protein